MTTEPDPCGSCGRLPLHDDPRASAMLLEAIREDSDGRMLHTEAWIRLSTNEDRLMAYRWLRRTLEQSPMTSKGMARLAKLLESVAGDLEYRVTDPLEESTVPAEHPLMFVPLPDDDEPPSTDTSHEELRAQLGWT